MLLSGSAGQRQLIGGAFSLLHNHFIHGTAVELVVRLCNSGGDTDVLRLIAPERSASSARTVIHLGKIVGMSGR